MLSLSLFRRAVFTSPNLLKSRSQSAVVSGMDNPQSIMAIILGKESKNTAEECSAFARSCNDWQA